MISRNPERAAGQDFDLIVVGGGVYGICLSLEASRRGLRPLLVERKDFGGGTSWNSLRIVHGGLRYLQNVDLKRFRESVGERRWWMTHFPEEVTPLACLMPLYGKGLHRPSVFRLALAVNDLLSISRNRRARPNRRIPGGGVLSKTETIRRFPDVRQEGLQGAAQWHDATMPDSQRLLVEMLHWACHCGATSLNYVEPETLRIADGMVEGMTGVDRTSGERWSFTAPVVVNCCGPWCRQLAASFDRDIPELFHASLAFNVLIDRDPLSDAGLAVAPPGRGARTYFVTSWKGKILAGTGHASVTPGAEPGQIPENQIADFLQDLNSAIPGLSLRESEVLRVHWGFLPAREEGRHELAVRETIVDHGEGGGPKGLFSVSGVKFTTARLVAGKVLEEVSRSQGTKLPPVHGEDRPPPTEWLRGERFEELLAADGEKARRHAEILAGAESVVELDDLLLRRTDWGMLPDRYRAIVAELQRLGLSGAEGALRGSEAAAPKKD